MPDKDISRITVERAIASVQRTRAAFRVRMPYGATKVKLTPAEARALHERMAPEERSRLAQAMGQDEYLRVLQEVFYGSRTPNNNTD